MRTLSRAGIVMLALLTTGVLAAPSVATEHGHLTTIAEGLDSPRGVAVAADGTIYVAEAGAPGEDFCRMEGEGEQAAEVCYATSSQITRIAPDGTVHRGHVPDLPFRSFMGEPIGASDVAIGADGALYISIGLGGSAEYRDALAAEWPPAAMFGTVQRWANGTLTEVFDVAQWESDNDPNAGQPSTEGPEGAPSNDSNPNSVLVTATGTVYVADAGGNFVLSIAPITNDETMVAFLPDRMVTPPPFLGIPVDVPMQAVPTSLTFAPGGAVHIGQLTGFPFPVGGANVWEVDDDTSPEIAEAGFTNIMDVGYRGDDLIVLEIAHHSLFAFEDGGALIRVRPDGSHQVLLTSPLFAPGGMAVDDDGTIVVSNFGVVPGGGTLLRVDPSLAADAATQSACPPLEVPAAGFVDLDGGVHYQAIECAAWYGLVDGFDDSTYGAALEVTRGQFASTVASLLEAAGVTLPEGQNQFSDTGATHGPAIEQLAAAGIVGGYDDGTFRPGESLTRGQAASIVVAAYEYATETTLQEGDETFSDTGGTHGSAINKAAAQGWVVGMGDGTFEPGGNISRGQVASVLMRVAATLVDDGMLAQPS